VNFFLHALEGQYNISETYFVNKDQIIISADTGYIPVGAVFTD
jgi:hypothetical protein